MHPTATHPPIQSLKEIRNNERTSQNVNTVVGVSTGTGRSVYVPHGEVLRKAYMIDHPFTRGEPSQAALSRWMLRAELDQIKNIDYGE